MNKESKLESLRLLFSPGFDDNDLLSILEEAQDDLDLAIARISEGQTATWELRKPKIKNSFRGRGRGGHSSHAHREFTPKESNTQVSKEPRNPVKSKGKVKEKEIKSNLKAGPVGVPEQKNNNQKKKKTEERKDKSSWAQLVKG
jgi:hypothetical protein